MKITLDDAKFEEMLKDLIEDTAQGGSHFGGAIGDDECCDGLQTFKEAGILTNNKGLVVHFSNGSEFQLTIVQSQIGREIEAEDFDEPYAGNRSGGYDGHGRNE